LTQSVSSFCDQQINDNLLRTKIRAAVELNYRRALYETITISADSVTILAKFVYQFLYNTTQKNINNKQHSTVRHRSTAEAT